MRTSCLLLLLAAAPLPAFTQAIPLPEDSSRHILMLPKRWLGIVKLGGYIQPQFQHAERAGIASYSGGDFAEGVDNRFLLRRGRLKVEYVLAKPQGYSSIAVEVELDATEKGVAMRDVWGRAYENKWHLFALTAGMMKRPFGYEVTQSSSRRETPERGRASQILMRGERDLGVMLSLASQNEKAKLAWLRADLAVMNGPGIAASGDYDGHKDFIARVWSRSQPFFRKKIWLSGGLSLYEGGIVNRLPAQYRNEGNYFILDSSEANIGRLLPRKYFGADAQLQLGAARYRTELRGEFLFGTQTGSIASSETPLFNTQVLATRRFQAAYCYLLQKLGNPRHQLVLKYDWYDPNTEAGGNAVDAARGFTAADVSYRTWGAGYVWDVDESLRLMLYYDHPTNERARIAGYAEDVKDDVFTARLQFRF